MAVVYSLAVSIVLGALSLLILVVYPTWRKRRREETRERMRKRVFGGE